MTVYDWSQLDASPPPPPVRPALVPVGEPAHGYAAVALDNECSAVATAANGTRNDTLNRASFNIGQLVAGGHLDQADAHAALVNASRAAGLPDHEIFATIQSGFDGGAKYPREVKPLALQPDGASLAALVAPVPGAVATLPGAPGGPVAPLVARPGAPGAPAALAAPQAAAPQARTSWWPLAIAVRAADATAAPAPTHLWREDGERLFYSGKINGLLGESESGKTWVGLKALADALLGGERCLLLDFEDSPGSIFDRLRALGVDDDALGLLDYANPDEALGLLQSTDLAEALRERKYGLIVVDGVNAAMTLLGYDLNSNTDATLFATKLLRPLAKTGACVITIDHVPKNSEARGKGGIGAQAKRAMMDGCALSVAVVEPFGKGQSGVLKLAVDKDRPGYVRGVSAGGKDAGRAMLDSNEDGTVRIRIAAPVAASTGPFRPTGLMEKVSRFLEEAAGPVTSNTVAQGIGGRRELVLKSLALLVADGYVAATTGPNRSHLSASTRPYRQHDDPQSDVYDGVVPVVPGGSSVVPRNQGAGGSVVPPPYRGDTTGPTTTTETEPIPEGYENCNRCGQLLPSWSLTKGYCGGCR